MTVNYTIGLLPRESIDCSINSFGPGSCKGHFDFTLLFEQSILSILPSTLLLLLVPLRLYHLYGASTKTLPDPLQAVKSLTALVFAAIQLALLVQWSSTTRSEAPRTSVPAAALSFVDAFAVIALSYAEDRKSVRPSTILISYLLFSTLFDAAQVRTLYLNGIGRSIPPLMSANVGIKVVLLLLEAQNKRSYLKEQFKHAQLEGTSGIISRSFAWWLNGLFRLGFRKLITLSDLYEIDDALKSTSLDVRMRKAWDKQRNTLSKYALLLTALRCLWQELVLVVPSRACLIAFTFTQPFLISRSIRFLTEPESSNTANYGYGLIGATALIYLGIAFCTVHYRQRWYQVATMFRGGMVALVFNRTLNLPDYQAQGAALSLMSTDIDNIVTSSVEVNELWARSIEVVIGIWLLARELGWPCIVPIILTCFSAYGQKRVMGHIVPRVTAYMAAVETRVTVTSSMLGGMKAVKMLGLSGSLTSTVHHLRLAEIGRVGKWLVMVTYANVIGGSYQIWTPIITFVIYTIKSAVNHEPGLNTAQAFVSLSIMSLVTVPALALLLSFPFCAKAFSSFLRLQEFLLLPYPIDKRILSVGIAGATSVDQRTGDEIEMITLRPKHMDDSVSAAAIVCDGLSVRPGREAPSAINNISFTIKKSQILVIIGPVGSGKTTLLKALLGELEPEYGSITISSKDMAYCATVPWLLNVSIQKSICGLSDAEIDEVWYETVLDACALHQDLEHLPYGDQSVIGSKGLTLSGGQKQRLALARAVYARRDIILLDDVLSAVDAATESILVNKLLGKNGLFHKLGTTVVVVTHATRHLPLADHIVVLAAGGNIAQQGSFELLQAVPGHVRSTLAQTRHMEDDEDNKPENKATARNRKAPTGPGKDDLMDLARRTGDMAVYGYYAKTMSSSSKIQLVLVNILEAFVLTFPQVLVQMWTAGGSTALYLPLYVMLGVVGTFTNFYRQWVVFLKVLPESATILHRTLLDTVMRAPQSFFAETDAGVTLNRFSQDMTLVDSQLPVAVLVTSNCLFLAIAQASLLAVSSGYLAIAMPIMLLVLYLIQNVYLKTSRQLRYMDLECKSPLYSNFLETLDGLATIRAFGWQRYATAVNNERLDVSQRPYYLLYCIRCWLTLVLDLMVAGIAVLVVALAVRLRSTTSAGLLGIAMNNLLTFSNSLQLLVRGWTQLETSLGAIARVRNFERNTPSEHKPGEDHIPPPDWPQQGGITFDHVSATYNDSTKALDDVSLAIAPGQKIGICGRTGSGKSSLLLALLRLLDNSSGTIAIDDLDLATLPRETIRAKLVAIPQDPFILAGSVRLNADPRGEASDETIVTALTKVRLWAAIEERGGLDADLQVRPLSHGQQQLFCLARAILRKDVCRVLVLDEATSNVDAETDQLMQKVLREEFKEHTIITVAHRLDTIIDSDRIAVMERGRLVEFDSPENLLAKGGAFRQMYGS